MLELDLALRWELDPAAATGLELDPAARDLELDCVQDSELDLARDSDWDPARGRELALDPARDLGRDWTLGRG